MPYCGVIALEPSSTSGIGAVASTEVGMSRHSVVTVGGGSGVPTDTSSSGSVVTAMDSSVSTASSLSSGKVMCGTWGVTSADGIAPFDVLGLSYRTMPSSLTPIGLILRDGLG